MNPTTASLPITRFALRLSLRWRRQLLIALLGLLYLVLLVGEANPELARTLFVVHLGLFILWQPFVRADQRISLLALGVVAAAVLAATLWLGGWLLTLWTALLAGVVGGKVLLFDARWKRAFFLLALAWLVAAMLLLALPMVLPTDLATGAAVRSIGRWALPTVLLLMLVLPIAQEGDGQPDVVDLVYSIIVVLLLAVLVLGSLAFMLLRDQSYVEALLNTLFGIGAALLILGWVWNPHMGMSGVGTLFSRYLMSIGMPAEQWLHELADLAQRQSDPEDFLAEACRNMVRRLPWVNGVSWRTESGSGACGPCIGHASEFGFGTLTLSIHTRYSLSPSLSWHFSLLAQLIAEFRADKLRARELKRLSYVEAIHETGARLTHDVKNLLQSLRGLCAAAQGDGDRVTPELVALLRRQLPAITARLGQTLDKLQVPRIDQDEPGLVGDWWRELLARYSAADVRFVVEGELPFGATIPVGLFDHVIENLLANALAKRAAEPGLRITVTLTADGNSSSVRVSDDGTPIPSALLAELFRGPVPSETGMGVGLYQAARLLEHSGYALSLVASEPGRVVFQLGPARA